jgi:hypothetical protein
MGQRIFNGGVRGGVVVFKGEVLRDEVLDGRSPLDMRIARIVDE